MINEDSLNLQIRKFLKKVGITSQRVFENEIKKSFESSKISLGNEVEIEMKMTVKDQNIVHIISDKIKID